MKVRCMKDMGCVAGSAHCIVSSVSVCDMTAHTTVDASNGSATAPAGTHIAEHHVRHQEQGKKGRKKTTNK